jgi:hypothetical protein
MHTVCLQCLSNAQINNENVGVENGTITHVLAVELVPESTHPQSFESYWTATVDDVSVAVGIFRGALARIDPRRHPLSIATFRRRDDFLLCRWVVISRLFGRLGEKSFLVPVQYRSQRSSIESGEPDPVLDGTSQTSPAHRSTKMKPTHHVQLGPRIDSTADNS